MKIIDIHTHGLGGYDTRTTSVEHLLKIAEYQAACGVSEIILTLYPSAVHEMRHQMDTIRKAIEMQQSSRWKPQMRRENRASADNDRSAVASPVGRGQAVIAGLHLEGPFLNPKRSGSLGVAACMKPSEDSLKELTEGFEDIIKIITIAPELPGALSLIRKLSDAGIIVSMGHSDATYAEAEAGFHAGARGITHLFNAMRGFHHREPGIAGFGLFSDNIHIEVIADPFHLDDLVIDLVFRIKKPDKIIIISDSVKETNTEMQTSGIRDDEGTLLGGSMTITQAAERLMRRGYNKDLIMQCVAENPERYLLHAE